MLPRLPDLLPLLLGEIRDLLIGEYLLAPDREEAHAERRLQQHEPALLRLGLHLGERLLRPFLEGLIDRLAPFVVGLALEGFRERRPGLVDERVHVLLQLHAESPGEVQEHGTLRILEVVHVAQVVRWRPIGGGLLEVPRHDRVLAGARRPEGVDVVPLMADPDRVLQRGHGPGLPHDPGRVGNVGGAVVGDLGRIPLPPEVVGRQLRALRFVPFHPVPPAPVRPAFPSCNVPKERRRRRERHGIRRLHGSPADSHRPEANSHRPDVNSPCPAANSHGPDANLHPPRAD